VQDQAGKSRNAFGQSPHPEEDIVCKNHTFHPQGETVMCKLLVVDDESNIRLLYTVVLADEGYEVVTAASIAEAEEKLRERTFDLAVLDIRMNNENGIELLRKLVRDRYDMPVILCSAFSYFKNDFSAWLADGYVEKSGDLTELKEEIARLLAKKAKKAKVASPSSPLKGAA
jgi:DNA-binding NtrC family response regulator